MSDKASKDPRFLERDELERELVRRDRQSLISDCLNIFDTNTLMFEQIEVFKGEAKDAEATIRSLNVEVDRLKARKFWTILNERIALRIENMRKRRSTPNHPTI